ncbi:MAG TPA: PVC-type heme-binding CxxCH protein, partial [Chryseosolibacter sp.]
MLLMKLKRIIECRANAFFVLTLTCFVLLVFSGCKDNSGRSVSRSALESLSGFSLEPGFKIELIAAEPLVSDPVAMEIDESGRMYVVEMHGYPLDLTGSGKIKLLADTDGDGKMDESKVFAEGLTLPTGIMRWKNGVIVTDPPNVLYFEDSDNDGRSDVRKVLLTGFAVTNPQHNINNPLLGLDNWIYLGHEPAITTNTYPKEFGDRGQAIVFPGTENSPILPENAAGRSIRFKPDRRKLELLSSKTQFGHTFDAWGHYFLVSNSNHVIQEVIPAAYLGRNPGIVVTDATQSLSDHGNAAEVFPTTKNPKVQMLTDVGVMTSACGIISYQGNAFPDGFNENITFVAEPVSNLIHVDRLKPNGASFIAKRVKENKEFLSSTDSWFRPVNMYIGPDGALYVLDYYRQIIEHPEWMSEEVNKSGALYNGTDLGRVYRISSVNAPPPTWTTNLHLEDLALEQLIQKLADPNIWWRKNAQRLLVDRASKNEVAALTKMTQNEKSSVGRLHALWTLEGIGQLHSDHIKNALKDSVAGVRENAIKLAEMYLTDDPTLATALLDLQDETDPRVRFQLLCTLGFIDTPEAEKVRQDLLFANIEDPWIQIAALSAPTFDKMRLMDAVLKRFNANVRAYSSLVQRLSAMAGASQESTTIQLLIRRATAAGEGVWKGAILDGLAEGLRAKDLAASSFHEERAVLINSFFNHSSPAVRKGSLHMLRAIGLDNRSNIQSVMQKAQHWAANRNLSPEQRVDAIDFLALKDPSAFTTFLKGLISTGEPLPVQGAAVRTLSAIPDQTVSKYILERWTSLTPDLRDMALNTFFENRDRVQLLIEAIEQGKIQKSSVGFYRSVRLRAQPDVGLRTRARALFNENENEQKKIIENYRSSLDLKGNDANGKVVFRKNCSSCHQVRGKLGTRYGPDLGTVHNWPPEGIMTNILDPNQSISDGFDVWEITLNGGEVVQGIISAETPNALTLRS